MNSGVPLTLLREVQGSYCNPSSGPFCGGFDLFVAVRVAILVGATRGLTPTVNWRCIVYTPIELCHDVTNLFASAA